MPRSFEACLWDIQQCGMDVLEVTQNKSEEDYLSDRHLRRIVERNLEIIGEALTQCNALYPGTLDSIEDSSRIIAFRNRLPHAYHSLNDPVVWNIVQTRLMPLLAEVTVLLDEWHQG